MGVIKGDTRSLDNGSMAAWLRMESILRAGYSALYVDTATQLQSACMLICKVCLTGGLHILQDLLKMICIHTE